MPYIKSTRKFVIDPALDELERLLKYANENVKDKGYSTLPLKAGDLNYIITRLILAYWKNRGNYQAINDISGVLTEANAEFRRRITAPYEKKKAKENGDVYNVLRKKK